MPKISSVYSRIVADFSHLSFCKGDTFQWSPHTHTITHPAVTTVSDLAQLLHEIGHAELRHQTYARDIQLIQIEREAWEYAISTLAPRYQVSITPEDEIVQSSLDTYRQWLHDRSTCPTCTAVGLEYDTGAYRCLSCQQQWRVNEARTCSLRRYLIDHS